MRKDDQRRIAHEILIILGLMLFLFLVLRMWPIVFLFILGIFAAALRMLFLSTKKVEVIQPAVQVEPPPAPAETEHDVLRIAYGVIQTRITEEVARQHPHARWSWETPNAMACISKDEPVAILLNGAGGYRRAKVCIHNLQFQSLDFVSLQAAADSTAASTAGKEQNAYADAAGTETEQTPAESAPVNYERLAFDWVEENLVELNQDCNEAIAHKADHLLIPEAELPTKESWPDICKQLLRNGFTLAMETDEGIKVNLPQ